MIAQGTLLGPTGRQAILAVNSRVGKDPSDLVRVTTDFASYNHALIRWDNGFWGITDQSRNGTFINGSRIQKHERYALHTGDTLSFGVLSERWEVVSDAAPMAFARRADGRCVGAESGTLILPPVEGDREGHLAEAVVYRSDRVWFVERGADVLTIADATQPPSLALSDGVWTLHLCDPRPHTLTAENPRRLDNMTLYVRPSKTNGDLTEIWAEFPNGVTPTVHFAWCSLLGYLAQAWEEDADTPVWDRGWSWNEVIQDHTLIPVANQANSITLARKWFQAQGVVDGEEIIRARPRQRQIGAQRIVLVQS